jgi:hypothetical protein
MSNAMRPDTISDERTHAECDFIFKFQTGRWIESNEPGPFGLRSRRSKEYRAWLLSAQGVSPAGSPCLAGCVYLMGEGGI